MSALKVLIFTCIYLLAWPYFSASENRYIVEIPKALTDFWKNDSHSFDNGEMSFPINDEVWNRSSDSGISIPNHIIEKRDFPHMDWNNELHLLRDTFFPRLPQYHKRGIHFSDVNNTGMTRIVQTTGTTGVPFMCTGVAVAPLVVLAAARCVSGLTISYTRLVQKNTKIRILVLVMPHNISKQGYDDIGVVVGDRTDNKKLHFAFLMNGILRNGDNTYSWFRNSSLIDKSRQYEAIGFAIDYDSDDYQKKGIHMYTYYELVAIDVIISMDICNQIYAKGQVGSYNVPCYHSCTYEEHIAGDEKCKSYLGVEGAVIFDKANGTVIGMATWGFESTEMNFPVGFSPLNSDQLKANLICGRHSATLAIKNAKNFARHPELCNDGCFPNNTMWYSNYFEVNKLENTGAPAA